MFQAGSLHASEKLDVESVNGLAKFLLNFNEIFGSTIVPHEFIRPVDTTGIAKALNC